MTWEMQRQFHKEKKSQDAAFQSYNLKCWQNLEYTQGTVGDHVLQPIFPNASSVRLEAHVW